MKNTLTDLNNHLFEQMEQLNSEELNDEELEKEIKRAKGMSDLAEKIIHSGELVIKAAQEGLIPPEQNIRLLGGKDA